MVMNLFVMINSIPQTITHIAGQFIDSCLFIYLVNHLFHPKAMNNISRLHSLAAVLISTAILFLSDVFSGNNYYWYLVWILLIPLIYSLLFFQGDFFTKLTICSIVTLLIQSFENLIVCYTQLFDKYTASSILLSFILFFIRRIGIKIVLFYLIKKLLLWPREYSLSLPRSDLMALFIISFSDIALLGMHVANDSASVLHRLVLITFLTFLPLLLLLNVKTRCVEDAKKQAMSAQISQQKIQNQYLEQQLAMTESLRKFRHDYKNQLFCMDALLEEGKYSQLHEYLSSLHQYVFKGNHIRRYVEDESLNILLNQKASMAEKLNIRFETDISFPQQGIVHIYDLNSLIGNLCDNAIEASATLPDASVYISIHKIKSYLAIRVSNTCAFDVMKVNPDFKSSKGNQEMHGLGLKIIKNIVQKYDGQYHVHSTDHRFTTDIMIMDEPELS